MIPLIISTSVLADTSNEVNDEVITASELIRAVPIPPAACTTQINDFTVSLNLSLVLT